MEEVITQEAVPSLMPAVAVHVRNPKHAQIFMQSANTLYPFGHHEEHLKRFCKASVDVERSCCTGESSETTTTANSLRMIVYTGCVCQRTSNSSTHRGDLQSCRPPVCHGCDAVRWTTRHDAFVKSLVETLHLCESEKTPFCRGLCFHLVHVPDRAPRRSVELWTKWNSIWPLSSPKPRLTEPLSSDFVQQVNTIMIRHLVPMCVSQLTRACAHDTSQASVRKRPSQSDTERAVLCGGRGLNLDATRVVPIAAAITNSSTNELLVTSEDCPYMCHSSNHSAYAPYGSLHARHLSYSSTAAHGGEDDNSNKCAHSSIHQVAACSSHCFSSASLLSGRNSVVTEHPVIFVLKKLSRLLQKHEFGSHRTVSANSDVATRCGKREVDKSRPYLANNMDLYVSHEPCIMCAMALVHSRIRHVYFCCRNTQHGGLGTVFAVHTIPSLNHHYRAFRCIVSTDILERALTDALAACSSTTEKDDGDGRTPSICLCDVERV